MGKAKRRDRRSKAALSALESPTPATRHTFSAGLLGHDLTASAWLVNVSEQTALGLDVVTQCVQIIADAVAGADVAQWNGTERVDPPSGFTLRPDPDITRREFLWLFTANLALYRAVYLEEARVDGQTVGVRIHCIANVLKQGDDYYVAGRKVLNPMRLVRLSVWPTVDPSTGSTIALAREVFAGAMAADAYRSDFWQQGGAPVVVLKTDQELTNTEAEAMSDRWVDRRTTSPGKPAVLSKGADAKGLGADLGTAGAHESGDKLRASIARFFNMPPGLVNVLSEAGPLTYTTVEAEGIHLVRYTVQPYCDVEGEALSAYLPGDYLLGDVIRLDPSRLTMADQLTRFQAWNVATGGRPFMRPSEVRAREGLAPDAAVDDLAAAPAAEAIASRDADQVQTTDAAGSFEIRDAEVGDGRTISGVAVPYGQTVASSTREYGNAAESFQPGAFRDAIAAVERGERLPIIDEHNGTVVGYADRLWDESDGLHYSGRTIEVPEAAPFAARIAARVLRVSIEFIPGEVRRAANAVIHTRVRRLGAIAGSYAPAYVGSSISVRSVEGSHVPEITEPVETPAAPSPETPAPTPVVLGQGEMVAIATRITDEAIRQYAARNVFASGQPADPFAEWRGLSLGQMAQRTLGVGEFAERSVERTDREWLAWATRTVADTVTTAGANAGMVTPGVIGDVHGIVSRGRPAISAFGGPRSSEGSGLSVDWPYFDGTLSSLVGAQSAQKAEITSVAVDVKKGTEALATYAGGSDISYQLLRKATRPYLDVYFRILLTAWAIVTDAAFVTELETGSVTSDFAEVLSGVDATEFKNLVVDASVAVETATGLPAQFVLASTTAFTQFAKLFTPVTSLANTGLGTLDLRSLQVNVGLLPVIHTPSVTAGKLIVSNREAAAWYEEGPFQAQDEDVMHLGRDVAIWSMGAGARFIPAGIIEMYDVTP